jgi:methionine synthase I (cobalamin-dependent)
MPKYRIEENSFIDNMYVKAGDEIETDATPSAHWTPLDKKATAASSAAADEEAARIASLQASEAKLSEAQQIIDAAAVGTAPATEAAASLV